VKLAFAGLGRMGQAMVHRLLDAGHEVVVYNRTPEKLADFIARGAVRAHSVSEAASLSGGLVLTMLADDKALAAVGAELAASLAPGGIHVAMGTHSVGVIRSLVALHASAGQVLLSAPVLGRPEAVTAGKLGIIVSGPPEAIAKSKPAFEAIGKRLFEAGTDQCGAAAMKLANNMLLLCAIEALGEAFVLVEKSGAAPEVFRDVLIEGLFACPAYTSYANIIAAKDYDKAGFTAQLALKDVKLVQAAGEAAGVPLPSAAVARDRLLGVIARGEGEKDWAILAREQARASGL
jgi:3-hydroxyisobutyrate dehydrogenase-like beta-hydroxyacid dehydrogenase